MLFVFFMVSRYFQVDVDTYFLIIPVMINHFFRKLLIRRKMPVWCSFQLCSSFIYYCNNFEVGGVGNLNDCGKGCGIWNEFLSDKKSGPS